MNGVIGMIDVLNQTELRPEQAEMINLMHDSADSLLRVIDDILDFSKIEAGKLPVESSPMRLESVVAKACALLDSTAANKDIGLTFFVDPDIVHTVAGDELRLRQVLTNLIGNAIKFSSGRPIRGQVSVRAQLIAQHEDSVTVDLIVADNGVGIGEEALARLFTPFTQADASTTRRFGGTGLGLAISGMLVRLMGGTIQVHSVPLQGSTFTVRIPFKTLASADQQEDTGALVRGLQCLLIGGDTRLADDLQSYLVHAGALVERCEDLMHAAGRQQQKSLWVWLILPDQPVPPIAQLNAMAARGTQTRFVALGHGRRRHPRSETTDLVRVDIDGLSRHSLFQALALAAGRISPKRLSEPARTSATAGAAPGQRLAPTPAKVLVAEDNATNRTVIQRQLQLLGLTAVQAVDGREALQLWRSGKFSLLLTDLAMPEMDGYALAAAIRAEEPAGRRIPIIALTGNALPEEAARTRTAGMDDLLVKPLRLSRLKSAVESWLGTSALQDEALPTGRWSTSADAPADLGVIRALVGDDPNDVAAVLASFGVTAKLLDKQLRDAAAAESPHAVGSAAHQLKTAAYSIGANRLGDLCGQLEHAAEDRRSEQWHTLLSQVQAALAAVRGFLDAAAA